MNTTQSSFVAGVVAALAFAASSDACGQNQTIEQVAQTIAKQHNQNANLMLDEMTVSSRAAASGKNVRFEYVLRVKQGLPKAKLHEFDTQNRLEIVPKVCGVKGNEIGFTRGLTYTFSYTNKFGEKLSEFMVDAKTCGIK